MLIKTGMAPIRLEPSQVDTSIRWTASEELRQHVRLLFEGIMDRGNGFSLCVELCIELVHSHHPADLDTAKKIAQAYCEDFFKREYALLFAEDPTSAEVSMSARSLTVALPADGDHKALAQKGMHALQQSGGRLNPKDPV